MIEGDCLRTTLEPYDSGSYTPPNTDGEEIEVGEKSSKSKIDV